MVDRSLEGPDSVTKTAPILQSSDLSSGNPAEQSQNTLSSRCSLNTASSLQPEITPQGSQTSTAATEPFSSQDTLPLPSPKLGGETDYYANQRISASSQEAVHGAERPISLKRQSSGVRLSMSLDGKAQITTASDSSPSPPRILPPPAPHSLHTGLQRSRSAASLSEMRSFSGRARDARTWEFFCDSDTRNALSAQAEQEQSGSALGAIGLIRSSSQRALTPNPSKRNAILQRAGSTKRAKLSNAPVQKQKQKLTRASSSAARMQQGNGKVLGDCTSLSKPSQQMAGQGGRVENGDSDKENWVPGTQSPGVRRRPQGGQAGERHIMRDSTNFPSHSTSLGAILSREKCSEDSGKAKYIEASDDLDPKLNGNGSAILKGEKVAAREEDLDCVNGLLSLSQGLWR